MIFQNEHILTLNPELKKKYKHFRDALTLIDVQCDIFSLKKKTLVFFTDNGTIYVSKMTKIIFLFFYYFMFIVDTIRDVSIPPAPLLTKMKLFMLLFLCVAS